MYQLEPLPYLYQDLEPYMDTHTMGLHYHKHAQNYLNKLNQLLVKNNADHQYSITELPQHIEEFSQSDREDILFNLGGVLNHDIYFKSMSQNPTQASPELKEGIINDFGSIDSFKQQLKQLALSLKGSGYTFLVMDQNNRLILMNFLNQETPYSYNLIPLIALDLWEHAYYINYENKKDLYIDNFLEVMDFKNSNQVFKAQSKS
ncbi:MAG: superoxide dismutase [bacterium]|nr:superoxide dismutase [bacterium]